MGAPAEVRFLAVFTLAAPLSFGIGWLLAGSRATPSAVHRA